MNARMQATLLAGDRLHLNDGPIDLIIGAEGAEGARERAFAAATRRFATILEELCSELSLLRAAPQGELTHAQGDVARRMDKAVRPLSADRFITPMAAVAGAVADEMLAAMVAAAPLTRAYVNNGGDIALHVEGDAFFTVGLVDRPDRPGLFGSSVVRAKDRVRGVATSGWRGRSFSLGIADAVTVLAADAARADAAATLIANAVDLPDHPRISRTPARDLDPQTDLGDRLVTRDVGSLTDEEIVHALDNGAREAVRLLDAGAIAAAALRLCGRTRVVGEAPTQKSIESHLAAAPS